MSNKVEEIMKNYRKGIKDIDKKYEVKEVKEPKKIDTSEIDSKVKYEQDFIARLKSESEENNKDLIEKAQERLKIAEEEKSRIEQENQKAEEKYQRVLVKREQKLAEVAKMKHSMVRHVIREADGEHEEVFREVTMAEKDEMDKNALKNDTIRKLTSENANISAQLESKEKELETKRNELQKQNEEQLKKKEEELKNKRKDLFNFKYKFDENHKITNKAEHQSLSKECKNLEKEIAKLKIADFSKELNPIEKEIKELTAMKEKCNEYLAELKETNKEFESFSKTWNEAKKDEDKNVEKTQTIENDSASENPLTAKGMMEDILRIQQTTNKKDFDSLLEDLDKKYENASDIWNNRIQKALEKQRNKIEDNIKQTAQKPKEQEHSKTEEEKANEQATQKHDDLEDIMSIFNTRPTQSRADDVTIDIPLDNDNNDNLDLHTESKDDDFEEIMSIFDVGKDNNKHNNDDINIPQASEQNLSDNFTSQYQIIDNDDYITGDGFENLHTRSGRLEPQLDDVEVGREEERENDLDIDCINEIILYTNSRTMDISYNYDEQYAYRDLDYTKEFVNNGEIYRILQDYEKQSGTSVYDIHKSLDPNVLKLLNQVNNKDQLYKYIEAVVNKSPMPFGLTYNLKSYNTEQKLSRQEYRRAKKFAKAVEGIEGVDIYGLHPIREWFVDKMTMVKEKLLNNKFVQKLIGSNEKPKLPIGVYPNTDDKNKKSNKKAKFEVIDPVIPSSDDFIFELQHDKEGEEIHINHEKAKGNLDEFVIAPENDKSYENDEDQYEDYKF